MTNGILWFPSIICSEYCFRMHFVITAYVLQLAVNSINHEITPHMINPITHRRILQRNMYLWFITYVHYYLRCQNGSFEHRPIIYNKLLPHYCYTELNWHCQMTPDAVCNSLWICMKLCGRKHLNQDIKHLWLNVEIYTIVSVMLTCRRHRTFKTLFSLGSENMPHMNYRV